MQAITTRTMDTTSSPAEVFAALLHVVLQGSYTIVALDNERHKLVFTSGKTMLSWGQEYVATVHSKDGSTRLDLACGGVDNRPKALLDKWKNGKAADKVTAATKAALASGAETAEQPPASFVTAPDGSKRPWTESDYCDPR